MPKCAFCGSNKKKDEFVEGELGPTCQSCQQLSERLEVKKAFKTSPKTDIGMMVSKPTDIKHELDKYIVGQEEAKRLLSVEIYNHLRRINNPDIALKKSNIILIGPSGSGKTYIFDILSKFLGIPIAVADATMYTEAGYVGKDVQSCLLKLVNKADGDIKRAEKGIVYIDEVDKIAMRKSETTARDVRGEGVQQAFLKMMEGADFDIEITNKNGVAKTSTINTDNILFVFGGAFEGIGNIITERIKKSKHRPLIQVQEDSGPHWADNSGLIETDDIIKFGFIREFVGRVPLIVTLKRLTIEEMMRVLTNGPNSIIGEYKQLFNLDGIDLQFEHEALRCVIEKSIRQKLGARGLRSVLSCRLNSFLYDAAATGSTKVVVTRQMIEQYGHH